jgi:hypothetical protein
MSSVVRTVRFLCSVHETTIAVRHGRKPVSDVVTASINSKSFYRFLGGTCLVTYLSGFGGIMKSMLVQEQSASVSKVR